MEPIDETVANMVLLLDECLYELWQERAAIREHDGKQIRELAEAMALLDVVRSNPSAAMSCWTRS